MCILSLQLVPNQDLLYQLVTLPDHLKLMMVPAATERVEYDWIAHESDDAGFDPSIPTVNPIASWIMAPKHTTRRATVAKDARIFGNIDLQQVS